MNRLELAKSVINSIDDMTFTCNVWASTGGACGDGWNDCPDLEVSKEEILHLISNGSDSELFKGVQTVKIDLDSKFANLAYEGAWPDGGPTARVKHPIPKELEELSNRISELDSDDKEAARTLMQELISIKEGEYTFIFDIMDGSHTYYFAECSEKKLYLNIDEALGLLWGYHQIDELFCAICVKELDEDDINDWADDANIADMSDNLQYGGSCEELDGYIQAMGTLLDKILDGSITEENLAEWMEYFDDNNNFDEDIEEWYNDNH